MNSNELLSQSDLQSLGAGIYAVIELFPPNSHFKKPLIAALSSHTDKKIISKCLNGTPHANSEYVRRAIQEIPDSNNELYTQRYSLNTHKNISFQTEEYNTLVNFFLKNTKAEKNPYGTMLTRGESETYLFHVFKQELNSDGIGLKTFLRIEKKLCIVKSKHKDFDLFFCPKCHKFKDMVINEKPQTEEEKRVYLSYLNYLQHKLRIKKQWKIYCEILDSLTINICDCLVVIDFTKKFTQYKKAVICSMVVFRSTDGVVKWQSFDFCGDEGSETSGNYFLQSVWEAAFRIGVFVNIGTIHIFHDKGSNELYNSSVLYIYSSLNISQSCRIFCHYFESCHGKSICDSHFGQTTKRGNNLLHFLKPDERYDHKFW